MKTKYFLLFLCLLNYAKSQRHICYEYDASNCFRENCRLATVNGEEQCLPVNCLEIELTYTLPEPFGCPEEFCVYEDFTCVNRRFWDVIVSSFLFVELRIDSFRTLFWCLIFGAAIAFLLLKTPKFLARGVSLFLSTTLFKRNDEKNFYVNVGYVSIALFGGKIFFQNFEYASIDHHIRIMEGTIQVKWWIPFGKVKSKADESDSAKSEKNRKRPYRLAFQLNGIEISVFNNSNHYKDLKSAFEDKRKDSASTVDDVTDAVEKEIETLLKSNIPDVYSWSPVTMVSFTHFCCYVGEPYLNSGLIFYSKEGRFVHQAVKIPETAVNHKRDLYRSETDISFGDIVIRCLSNPDVSFSNSDVNLKSPQEKRGKLIGVFREAFSYVRDIVDEEILFATPDLTGVGLSGADYRTEKQGSGSDSLSDDSLSDDETKSSDTRRPVSLKMLPSLGLRKQESTLSPPSFTRPGFWKSWSFNKPKNRSSRRRRSSVVRAAESEVRDKKKSPEPHLFHSKLVEVRLVFDIPGKQDERNVEVQEGYPLLSVSVDVGTEFSDSSLCLGPWSNSLLEELQARYCPDTFLDRSVFKFKSGRARAYQQLDLCVGFKGTFTWKIPFEGRFPESVLSDSGLSSRQMGTSTAHEMWGRLQHDLDQTRMGRIDDSSATPDLQNKKAEIAILLRDLSLSQFLGRSFKTAPEDVSPAAGRYAEWLLTCESITDIEDWKALLTDSLINGWVIHPSVSVMIALREKYVSSNNLSRQQFENERRCIHQIGIFQKWLLTAVDYIQRENNAEMFLAKCQFLSFRDLTEEEANSPLLMSKKLAALYVGKEVSLVKALKPFVSPEVYMQLFKETKNLFLLLPEKVLKEHKILKKLVEKKGGREYDLALKLASRQERRKKSVFYLLKAIAACLEKPTARLPRWLDLFGVSLQNLSVDGVVDKKPFEGFSSDDQAPVEGPLSSAKKAGCSCKWFVLSFGAGSAANFSVQLQSLNRQSLETLAEFKLNNVKMSNSSTELDIFKSPNVGLRMLKLFPVVRCFSTVTKVGLTLNSAEFVYLKELDVDFQELVSDWFQKLDSIRALGYKEYPEVHESSSYDIKITGNNCKLAMNAEEGNIYDTSNFEEQNVLAEFHFPVVESEIKLPASGFRDFLQHFSWKLKLESDSSWKKRCSLKVIYPKHHVFHNIDNLYYNERGRRYRALHENPKIARFQKALLEGEYQSEETLTRRSLTRSKIRCAFEKLELVFSANSKTVWSCLINNLFGKDFFSMSRSDYEACDKQNVRSLLAEKQKERLSKSQKSTLVFNLQCRKVSVLAPLSLKPNLAKGGWISKPKDSCFTATANLLKLDVCSQTGGKLRVQANCGAIFGVLPSQRVLGSSALPVVRSYANSQATPAAVDRRNETKAFLNGKQTSNAIGFVKVPWLSVNYQVDMGLVRPSSSYSRWIKLRTDLQSSIGSVQVNVQAAHLEVLAQWMKFFMLVERQLKSKEGCLGGYEVVRSKFVHSSSINKYSLIGASSSGRERKKIIVKGFIDQALLKNFLESPGGGSSSFSVEVSCGEAVFSTPLVSSQTSLEWEIPFHFKVSEPCAVLIQLFEHLNGEKKPLGRVYYNSSAIENTLLKNSSPKNNAGFSLDGLSARWLYLQSCSDSSSESWSSAHEQKLQKLNGSLLTNNLLSCAEADTPTKVLCYRPKSGRSTAVRLKLFLTAIWVTDVVDSTGRNVEESAIISRCFRFTSSLLQPEHSRKSRFNSFHLMDGGKRDERERILKRLDFREIDYRTVHSLALLLYTDEAFDTVAERYCHKSTSVEFCDLSCLVQSPVQTSLLHLQLSGSVLRGQRAFDKAYCWKTQLTRPLVFQASMLTAANDLDRKSSSEQVQQSQSQSDRKWLLVGQFAVEVNFSSVDAILESVAVRKQQRRFFEGMHEKSNKQETKIPEGMSKSLFFKTKLRKLKAFTGFECLSHSWKQTVKKQIKVRIGKKLRKKKKKIDFVLPIKSFEENESFVSAEEEISKETALRQVRTAVLNSLFSVSKVDRLNRKRSIAVHSYEPFPMIPGATEDDKILLKKILPVFATKEVLEKKLQEEDVSTANYLPWSCLSSIKLIQGPNVRSMKQVVFSAEENKREKKLEPCVLKGEKGVVLFLQAKKPICCFLTSSLVAAAEDFLFMVKRATPTCQHLVEDYVHKSLSANFDQKESLEPRDSLKINVIVAQAQVDWLQAVPKKRGKDEISVNTGVCFYKTRFLLNNLLINVAKEAKSHCFSLVSSQVSANISTLFSDTADFAKPVWFLVTEAVARDIFFAKSEHSDKRNLQISLADLKMKAGADSPYTWHSLISRLAENILAFAETWAAIDSRSSYQWYILSGHILRLAYKVEKTLGTRGPSHFRELLDFCDAFGWDRYMRKKHPTKVLWPTLVRLQQFVKYLKDAKTIELELASLPLDRQAHSFPLPASFVANVADLQKYFASQTLKDGVTLKPSALFLIETLEGSHLLPSNVQQSEPHLSLLNVSIKSAEVKIFSSQAKDLIAREQGAEATKEICVSATLLTGILRIQGLIMALTWQSGNLQKNSFEVLFKSNFKADTLGIITTPFLLYFFLVLSQVSDSFQSYYKTYHSWLRLHRQYHKAHVLRRRLRPDMEVDVLRHNSSQEEDSVHSEGVILSGDPATSIVSANEIEDMTSQLGEDTGSVFDFSLAWNEVKTNRQLLQRKDLKALYSEKVSDSSQNENQRSVHFKEDVEVKPKVNVVSSRTERSFSDTSASSAEKSAHLFFPRLNESVAEKSRMKRAGTISGKGLGSRLVKSKTGKRSYESSALDRSASARPTDSREEEELQSIANKERDNVTYSASGYGSVAEISIVFTDATETIKKNSTRLELSSKNMGVNFSIGQILVNKSIPGLKADLMLDSDLINIVVEADEKTSSNDSAAKKASLRWDVKHSVLHVCHIPRKKHLKDSTTSDVRVLVSSRGSSFAFPLWRFNMSLVNDFFSSWLMIYKRFLRKEDINQNYIREQRLFLAGLLKETPKSDNVDKKIQYPEQNWRSFRQRLYDAAKSTTTSVNWLVDANEKYDTVSTRYVFTLSLDDLAFSIDPTSELSIFYTTKRFLLQFDRKSSREIKSLFWIDKCELVLLKEKPKLGDKELFNQVVPGFWMTHKLGPSSLNGEYEFDLSFLVEKASNEITPNFVEHILQLQTELAQETLKVLSLVSKISEQWKNSRVPTTTKSSHLHDLNLGKVKKYSLVLFVEGITLKALDANDEKNSLSWVDANSGGVYIKLGYERSTAVDKHLHFTPKICFEGMDFQFFNRRKSFTPCGQVALNLEVSRSVPAAATEINPLRMMKVTLSDVECTVFPGFQRLISSISSVYLKAFRQYTLLRKKAGGTVKDEPQSQVAANLSVQSPALLFSEIDRNLSILWKNLQEPLGKELSAAASRIHKVGSEVWVTNGRVKLCCFQLDHSSSASLECSLAAIRSQFVLTRLSPRSQHLDLKQDEFCFHGHCTLKDLSFSPGEGKSNVKEIAKTSQIDLSVFQKNSAVASESLKVSLGISAPHILSGQGFIRVLEVFSKHWSEQSLLLETDLPDKSQGTLVDLATKELAWFNLSLTLRSGALHLQNSKQEAEKVRRRSSSVLPLPSLVVSVKSNRKRLDVQCDVGLKSWVIDRFSFEYLCKVMSVCVEDLKREVVDSSEVKQSKVEFILPDVNVSVFVSPLSATVKAGQSCLLFEQNEGTKIFLKSSAVKKSVSGQIGSLNISVDENKTSCFSVLSNGMYFCFNNNVSDKSENNNILVSVNRLSANISFWTIDKLSSFLECWRLEGEDIPNFLKKRNLLPKETASDFVFQLGWLTSQTNSSVSEVTFVDHFVVKTFTITADLGNASTKLLYDFNTIGIRRCFSNGVPVVLGAYVIGVTGTTSGSIDSLLEVTDGIFAQVVRLPHSLPKKDEFLPHEVFVSSENLPSVFETPNLALSIQPWLAKRSNLFAFRVSLPVFRFCTSTYKNKTSQVRIPVASVEIYTGSALFTESFDNEIKAVNLDKEVVAKTVNVEISIDAVPLLSNFTNLLKSQTQKLKLEVNRLFNSGKGKKHKKYPDSDLLLGDFLLKFAKFSVAVSHGFSEEALSLASACFTFHIFSLKTSHDVEDKAQDILRSLYFSTNKGIITRYQQLLPNRRQRTQQKFMDDRSTVFSLGQSMFTEKTGNGANVLKNATRRRERQIFLIPKSNISVKSRLPVKWITTSSSKTSWTLDFEETINYSFVSKFSRPINVSTDLRDYTYLREIVEVVQRLLDHSDKSTNVEAQKVFQFMLEPGSDSFVFNPKLNVIGDATSLAVNLVLSKLGLQKADIPVGFLRAFVIAPEPLQQSVAKSLQELFKSLDKV